MTLKVIIQPSGDWIGLYPVYHALDDGVKVGPSGELILVSERQELVYGGQPLNFRIYAPGTWKEVNVEHIVDE